jgi:hypothetical protein
VTGTVELKGSISLGGDLIVDGGTLVARSGVALRGNGHQIMFMNGGSADFQGSPTSTWSGDGSNANLSRDVVFDGLARIMWHEGAGPSTLRFVRVTNSGVQEKLGFYPLHWHLNGNSVRGTLVEGVVVDKAKNHAFVPHGSHGIRFKDTIAHTVVREAYWWDSGDISNDITYDHVLAVNVVYPRSLGDLPLHHRMSAFHLGKGTGNVVANSVARNTSGGADCSGFHWPEADHGVWTFRNNSAYGGSCNGIFVWQNDSLPHVIAGFNGNLALEHGAYGNVYKFFDVDVPEIEVHALGRCHNDSCSSQGEVLFQGGSVDQVVESKHVLVGGPVRFRNMTIGSFVKNPSPGNAGVFFFEKTTLSCSNIVGSGPSTIIIDGNTC